MEDTTGPNGYPIADEMNPDMDGWFEAVAAVNYATAAKDRWHSDNEQPEPGTVLTVIDTRNTTNDD